MRNESGIWASQPRKQLRKDKVFHHSQPEMHASAVGLLAIALVSDSGIAQVQHRKAISDPLLVG